MNHTIQDHITFCTEMLPRVSRTFAPTIRMLPKKLFLPVTAAYLLCRIADTVEDEPVLTKEEKQTYLALYADLFNNPGLLDEFASGVAHIPDHSPDVILMKNLNRVISVFKTFSPEVQRLIGIWVVEMVMGMKKFVQV